MTNDVDDIFELEQMSEGVVRKREHRLIAITIQMTCRYIILIYFSDMYCMVPLLSAIALCCCIDLAFSSNERHKELGSSDYIELNRPRIRIGFELPDGLNKRMRHLSKRLMAPQHHYANNPNGERREDILAKTSVKNDGKLTNELNARSFVKTGHVTKKMLKKPRKIQKVNSLHSILKETLLNMHNIPRMSRFFENIFELHNKRNQLDFNPTGW